LTDSLLSKSEVVLAVTVIDAVRQKGCYPNEETFNKLFAAVAAHGDPDTYSKAVSLAEKLFSANSSTLVSKYPLLAKKEVVSDKSSNPPADQSAEKIEKASA
jgi:hypothetical protein